MAFKTFSVKAGVEWLRRVELRPLDRLLLDSFIEQIECLQRLIGMSTLRLAVELSINEDVKLSPSLQALTLIARKLLLNSDKNIFY